MDRKTKVKLRWLFATPPRLLPAHPGRQFNIHFILCFLLLTATSHLTGQVNTGDVVGTVTDVSGAALPDAKVTIQNTGTGISRTILTGKTGDYSFSLLQVGTYQATIEARGFRTFVTRDVNLSAGDRVRVDALMQIATVSESASVSAQAATALQTDSSTIGTLIPSEFLADLPLNGRNLTSLVQLAAGVTAGASNAPGGGTNRLDRRLTSAFSANGQNDIFNNNMIDGMDNNERYFGTIVVRPSVDAVQEVDVSTNLYPAEISRTEGGVADVITKSGTNAFHGSLFEYLRNDIFDARDYFATTGPVPKLRQNEFGGSIGGPIRKNKTFFLFDYEGFRQVWAQNTYTSTVPTAAQESLVTAAVGQTIPAGSLLRNTSPFVVSQLGKNLFSLYPTPTNSATKNNFVYSPVRTQFSHTFDVRVDHQISDRDTLFARYSFNDVNTYTPGNLPNVSIDGNSFGSANSPGLTGGPVLERGQNLGLDYVHIFQPKLLLELKFSYLRFANHSLTINGRDAGVELGFDPCSLGTGYCMNADAGGAQYGLPAFSVASPYSGLGDAIGQPLFDYNNTFQYQGSLTWNRNAHSVKTGASLIRRQLNFQRSLTARGSYAVNGTFTGSGLGDLLAGYASDAQLQNDVVFPHFRSWEVGGYVQDDWRATRWLTLNLGVRYEIFTPFTEVNGYISSFDTTTGYVVSPDLSGPNHGTSTANVKTDFTNISPRLGFSASLSHNMVLRGGFGLSYFPNELGTAALLQNVPFEVSRDCGGDSSYPVECPSAIAGPGGLGLTMARGLWQPTIDPTSAYYPNEALGTGVAAGTEIDAVANNLKSGRLVQYSLQFQKELGANLISLGYVGNLGRHLPLVPNINQATYATYNYSGPGCVNNGKPTYASSCFTQGPIPYPAYSGDQIYVLQSAANSNYNALQASFLHRFSAGLNANVNYTWSHILNNGSPQGEGGARPVECVRDGCLMDSGNGTPIPVNSFRQYDYGNGDLDVRQRFTVMLNYAPPFGASLHGAVAYLAKGWSINTIYAYSTGLPISISEQGGGPPGTITNASGILGFRGGDAPNQVGNPNAGNVHSIEEWFNTSAFAVQTPGLLGNARRNCIYGPPLRHLDLSLVKDLPLRETLRLQFRVEAFNLTNTPNFAEPNNNLGSPTFGEITSTAIGSNPRLLQFALRLSF